MFCVSFIGLCLWFVLLAVVLVVAADVVAAADVAVVATVVAISVAPTGSRLQSFSPAAL